MTRHPFFALKRFADFLTLKPVILVATLGFMAIPATASASDDYDTAIACAGSLNFLVTVLPAGSEPAQDASSRSAIWQKHAKNLTRKSDFDVKSDLQASSEKTKTLMMGGDQAAAAAYLGPLNEICATLPVDKPATPVVANPFELEVVTMRKNYDHAVVCAGMQVYSSMGDPIAQEKLAKFERLAKQSRPDLNVEAIQHDINKANEEWMVIIFGNDVLKGAPLIGMCDKAYTNLD